MDEVMEVPLIIKDEVIVKSEIDESDEIEAIDLPAKFESVSTKNWLKCDECEMTFLKSWALKSHKRTHFPQKPFKPISIIKEEVVVEGCELSEVEDNAEIKSETVSSDAIDAVDNLSEDHDSASLRYRFKCDVCAKMFTKSAYLINHMRMHTGEKPYKCTECDFASSWSNSLPKHMLVHSGEKPFACDQCSFVCALSPNLKTHKLIHSGEKPHSCDVCDYSTSQSGALKLHKRIHTGERPYNCDICHKAFQRKHHLDKHINAHSRMKVAPICVFSCLKCEYTSNSERYLKAHQVTHSDARPFMCNQCDSTFKHKESLTKHERSHSGERPYSCQECGKKFTQSGILTAHMKRIHLKGKN